MPPKPLPGYAGETEVPVERSKAQIEGLLLKHGAEGYHTGWQAPSGDNPGWDAIEFLWKGRQIRFRLARPTGKETMFLTSSGMRPRDAELQRKIDQRNRQRWRILFLVIKAKLEAVDAGVSVFEEEFLAHIVTESNRTIGEILLPRLEAGNIPLQLEAGS